MLFKPWHCGKPGKRSSAGEKRDEKRKKTGREGEKGTRGRGGEREKQMLNLRSPYKKAKRGCNRGEKGLERQRHLSDSPPEPVT